MSKRRIVPVLTAALALLGAGAPVSAQSTYRSSDEAELLVQNNRSVPVTVYLEGPLFERELGKVEPMRSATFSVPKLREGEMVELLIQPRGQIALKGRAFMTDEALLGLVIPATPGQERRAQS